MVTIAVTSESADEPRVAVSPDTVKKFTGLGAKVRVELGAGLDRAFPMRLIAPRVRRPSAAPRPSPVPISF